MPLVPAPAAEPGRRCEAATREPGDLPPVEPRAGGVPWQCDGAPIRRDRTLGPTPGNSLGTSRLPQATDPPPHAAHAVTLFVCTTCRTPGVSEGEPDGRRLAEAALALPATPGLVVKPVRCLSNCKRGLSAALIREGGWTYVFGDLSPAPPLTFSPAPPCSRAPPMA